MTIYYVDSAAGSNTSPYDTWAKAATLINTVAALCVAGDTVYVASTHVESSATASWVWASTLANPIRVLCADKTSGAPPTALATGASVTSTGSGSTLTPNNDFLPVYFYGIDFSSNATAIIQAVQLTCAFFEQCSFQNAASSSGDGIAISSCYLKNCRVKFNNVGQAIKPTSSVWSGGSLLPGSVTPTSFVIPAGGYSIIENFDFSSAGPAMNLANVQNVSVLVVFRKCKLPPLWTGSLGTSVNYVGGGRPPVVLINCDTIGTNYNYHLQTALGDITEETTLVRSGGASNGATPQSWKLSSAAASGVFPLSALRSAEFEIWNDSTSPVTVTVEYLHDNVTGLKNNEIWIEVRYTKDAGDTLGDVASSAPANVLAAATTNTSSSATWTTTGMTNPNTQKMAVTFTPAQKGPVYVSVLLAKASYTAYVDPLPTLS